MADIEQTTKVIFADGDSDISRIEKVISEARKLDGEFSRLTEPQDSKALLFNPIDVTNEIFPTIQAEADRKRSLEDSVIKLANQTTCNNIFDDSQNAGTKITHQPRTRKTNLIRAIEAAVATFDTKPSLDELWRYFENDHDETGFIEDFRDDCLTWRDTKGNLHDTKKATIANHLSRINS